MVAPPLVETFSAMLLVIRVSDTLPRPAGRAAIPASALAVLDDFANCAHREEFP